MADVVQMTLDTGLDHLYQWDLNRKLIVPSTLTEVRFVQPGKSTALRVAVVDGTADVPNILLQASGSLTAFAFITDHTVYAQTWLIDQMNKPDDYVYTATEILSWTTINDEAQAAIADAQAALASANSLLQTANTINGQSQTNADACTQAYADLLAKLGTDVVPLVGGKIPIQYIPATAIIDYFPITDESQLTSLTAQKGDFAFLTENFVTEEGATVPRVSKTIQLLGDDPTVASNWIVWGSTYATTAGNAAIAETAVNSTQINGHRMEFKTEEEFVNLVKDPDTYYCVEVTQ